MKFSSKIIVRHPKTVLQPCLVNIIDSKAPFQVKCLTSSIILRLSLHQVTSGKVCTFLPLILLIFSFMIFLYTTDHVLISMPFTTFIHQFLSQNFSKNVFEKFAFKTLLVFHKIGEKGQHRMLNFSCTIIQHFCICGPAVDVHFSLSVDKHAKWRFQFGHAVFPINRSTQRYPH